jgi:hypothetical protein
VPKFSRLCLILATMVVSFALLTACGGGGGGGSGKSASASTSAPPPAAPDPAPSTPSNPDPVTPPSTPAPDPVPEPTPPATAPGATTLSWVAPTLNNDGGALEELAGYRIRYGQNPEELDRSIVIDDPAVLECAVEQLASGTWYFEVVAHNAYGLEGPSSNLASRTVL